MKKCLPYHLFVILIIFDKRYSVGDICFKITLLVKFEAFPKSVQVLLIHAIPVVQLLTTPTFIT